MTPLALRGVMLDPARVTERPRYYQTLIPLLGRWGYNTLLWHFTDDQGCALRFPRRPEIATPHALTQQQTRRLVRFAGRHGLSVIPEVECFGHTACITRLPRYKHLQDGVKGKAFAAMCPFTPDARSLLKDLLTDAAETFDSPFIHVGMDEVGFGDHPVSRRLLRTKTKPELFAEHVCWLHGVVTSLGKRMMMWGDHLLGKATVSYDGVDASAVSQTIARSIPKDIVICDWHYNPRKSQHRPGGDDLMDGRTLDFLLGCGFEVIACPAVSAWSLFAHPRQWNLDNLRDFTVEASKRSARGVVGVINTTWCPWRYLPGATLYAMALGATLQQTGGKAPCGFANRFVTQTFELARPENVAKAMVALHSAIAHSTLVYKALPACISDITGLTPQQRKDLRRGAKVAGAALKVLVAVKAQVTAQREFFEDIVCTARVLALLGQMPDRLKACRIATGKSDPRGRAKVRELATEMKALHQQVIARWNYWRYADDPKRQAGGDGLAGRLGESMRYVATFAK